MRGSRVRFLLVALEIKKQKASRKREVFAAGVLLFSPGEVPERPNGADCKSAGYAFGGSNPSLSTGSKKEKKIKSEKDFRSRSSVGRALPW